MHRYGEDVLLKRFHPVVDELGWDGAFTKAFGQSSSEFASEFEAFMDLRLNEQVKVLPKF
jgi:hypothetical protein